MSCDLPQLEMRLADKEEKLLEKELIYEEVSRLSERAKKKAETGKEDTLNLAKKVGAAVIGIIIRITYLYIAKKNG